MNIELFPNLFDKGILFSCLTAVKILRDSNILKNNLANIAPGFNNNSKRKKNHITFLFSWHREKLPILDTTYVGGVQRNGRLYHCSEIIDSPFHVRGLSIPACCCASWSSFCRGGGWVPAQVILVLTMEGLWVMNASGHGMCHDWAEALRSIWSLCPQLSHSFFLCHENSVSQITNSLSPWILEWENTGSRV